MLIVLQALSFLIGIGSLVCWIMEIIAAFKKESSPMLGILSIVPCLGLGGLVVGWMKHREWGITQLMTIWTGLIVLGFLLNVAVAALGIGAAGAAGAGGVPAFPQ